ncbi:microtubule-binding protein BIM1 [Sporobolomyces salmoneus]|uniref:microtubule-binding protein BIM1 n=1 Tax=Sporobolomyces salmoneus TaxID=183962 RepID=UPI00316DBB70
MAGESRSELLGWINDLLQLNYTKIEQCGTGAVYCQIFDSIYQDLPMSKVKFDAKVHEYLTNYKILQASFKKHGLDKAIPVEALCRCKPLDNLEFLQWCRKFWLNSFPGTEYDAVARRRGMGGNEGARAPSVAGSRSTSSSGAVAAASRRPAAASRPAASSSARPMAARTSASSARSGPSNNGGVDMATFEALTSQMGEMKLSVEGLEKERDFYFNKLRDIEIIIGARLESAEGADMAELEKETLLQMQQILYSTEEGFEVPDEEGEGGLVDEEETF